MIALLTGDVALRGPTSSVLDCHGVGYEILHTPFTASDLQEKKVTVHVHTHVREDALVLFGFSRREERDTFRELIKITGIGPKMALSILSGIRFDDLVAALSQKDLSRLQKIPGIGKKTAERLSIEWKGPAIQSQIAGTTSVEGELESVLENLGYQSTMIQQVIRQLREKTGNFTKQPLEVLVRSALGELTRSRTQ